MSVYGTGGSGNISAIFSALSGERGRAEALPAKSIRSVRFQNASTLKLNHHRCRIINLLSIACAAWHGLRSRLTLGRTSLPRKPWVYGGLGFHQPLRYLCLHPHFRKLHRQSPSGFDVYGTLPYQMRPHGLMSRASVCSLSPIIFGAEPLDESAITHCLNGGCF